MGEMYFHFEGWREGGMEGWRAESGADRQPGIIRPVDDLRPLEPRLRHRYLGLDTLIANC